MRVGAELIISKTGEGRAANYTSAMERHLRNCDEARRAAAGRVQIFVGTTAPAATHALRGDAVDTGIDTGIDTGLQSASPKCAKGLVGHLGFEPRANGLRKHSERTRTTFL